MKHTFDIYEMVNVVTITQDKILVEMDTETLLDLIEMLQQEVSHG